MKLMPQIESARLKRHANPFEYDDCSCGSNLKCSVDCAECFQYPIACGQCFVDRHRHHPFHWAYVWSPTERVFVKTDYTAVLPENEGISLQLGHPGNSVSCARNQKPLTLTIVDYNGIHSSRVRFCCCSEPGDHATQLLEAGLFPATTSQCETAFTFSLLKHFQMHNIQTKANAFDWILSLRRLTDNISTYTISVRRTNTN
jgi:hypothetical protein